MQLEHSKSRFEIQLRDDLVLEYSGMAPQCRNQNSEGQKSEFFPEKYTRRGIGEFSKSVVSQGQNPCARDACDGILRDFFASQRVFCDSFKITEGKKWKI
jgi:hypothetical protein